MYVTCSVSINEFFRTPPYQMIIIFCLEFTVHIITQDAGPHALVRFMVKKKCGKRRSVRRFLMNGAAMGRGRLCKKFHPERRAYAKIGPSRDTNSQIRLVLKIEQQAANPVI